MHTMGKVAHYMGGGGGGLVLLYKLCFFLSFSEFWLGGMVWCVYEIT